MYLYNKNIIISTTSSKSRIVSWEVASPKYSFKCFFQQVNCPPFELELYSITCMTSMKLCKLTAVYQHYCTPMVYTGGISSVFKLRKHLTLYFNMWGRQLPFPFEFVLFCFKLQEFHLSINLNNYIILKTWVILTEQDTTVSLQV